MGRSVARWFDSKVARNWLKRDSLQFLQIKTSKCHCMSASKKSKKYDEIIGNSELSKEGMGHSAK